ncbi:MAG: hypothetical protein AAF518_21170 [Spirochaetota bacterium]
MSEETLYFINLLSHDNDSRAHVLFCALLNKTTQKVEGFDAVVCLSSDNTETPEYASFKDVIGRIQKLKFEAEIARSSTTLLVDSLKKSFASESYMIELMHYLEHGDTEKIKSLFKDKLAEAIGGISHPTIKIIHKEVSREESEKPGVHPSENKEENSGEEDKPVTPDMHAPITPGDGEDYHFPEGATVARFDFVLSPVSGKRIDELQAGEKIMVKIKRDDSGSRNVINLLMLEDEETKSIRAIPAEIEHISQSALGYQINVKITDGIYASNLEDEPTVKAKLAGSETLASVLKGDATKKTEAVKEEPASKTNVFVMIGLVVALLWIAVYFLVIA